MYCLNLHRDLYPGFSSFTLYHITWKSLSGSRVLQAEGQIEAKYSENRRKRSNTDDRISAVLRAFCIFFGGGGGDHLHFLLFYVRVVFVSFLFICVRRTLSRFRYDILIYLHTYLLTYPMQQSPS